jgi:hypothetical protein
MSNENNFRSYNLHNQLNSSLLKKFDREIPEKGQISIPDDFRLDLCRWRTFLPSYNGVSLMLSEEWSRADQIFSVDYLFKFTM